MRRRDLITGSAAASALALAGGGSAPVRAMSPGGRKLIVVWVNGAWDVSYCMDPKPGAPLVDGPEDHDVGDGALDEEVRTFGDDLRIQCNDALRPSVSRFFEKWASRVAVVNGVQVGSIGHDPARFRMLTGTPDSRNPDLAVITGHALGSALPLGSLDFSGYSLAGDLASSSGRIGAHGQLEALLDPYAGPPPPPGSTLAYPLHVPDADGAADAEALLLARTLRFLESHGRGTESRRRIEQYFDSQDRVERFRAQAADILSALADGQKPGFSSSLGLAVDLFARNVCQSAFVDTGLTWDTHVVNTAQGKNFEALFDGLDDLMHRLYEPGRGDVPVEDGVVVAVLSDFTRTPRFNLDGGKDHWPVGSAMLLGDGVRGGRTLGGTDDLLGELRVDLQSGDVTESGEYLSYASLVAGILEHCGVDPGEWLPDATPFRGATA